MKKCIAFELCNVILDMDYSHFNQILSEIQFDPIDARRYMKNNTRLDQSGIISMKDIFEEDFDPVICDELLNAWNDVPKLNVHMFKFLENLRSSLSSKVDIVFLSSIGKDHLDKVRSDYPELMELADVQHMSCEVGIIKPKKLFYQSLFMNNKYEWHYYFDDKQESLDAFHDLAYSNTYLLNLNDLTQEELKYKICYYEEEIQKL
jgi:FMN phosphatase YigB (HAD superfamily)